MEIVILKFFKFFLLRQNFIFFIFYVKSENKIDKTVVNVDASQTNTSLSALEVLEKSPGVTVDNDGNIKLKGKQGVIIMIDGKPAYLSGQDLTNYLRNLPSNQLDQIELMTQPSAKYDASGNSGIINFKTKKNKNNGFNGSFTTSEIIANYFKNNSIQGSGIMVIQITKGGLISAFEQLNQFFFTVFNGFLQKDYL